jgi:hypothetical protein
MTGVIVGGWEYVIAAYTLYWVFVGGYAVSLWIRSREQR